MAAIRSAAHTLTIKGKSGKAYIFYVHKLPVSFEALAGLYLFTKDLQNGNHTYVYLGITNNLSERFDNHHKQKCITQKGATHLSACPMATEKERIAAEKDILAAITTTCNELMN